MRSARDTAPSRHEWRVLPLERDEPEALLARGVRLLDELAADPVPTLRWYESTSPALVLGRGQDRTLLTSLQGVALPAVARSSGGGAVLLDADLLSCDVLVPAGHPLLAGDLSAVYLRIGHAWAAALRGLGLPEVAVRTGPTQARTRGTPREQLLAAVCYATVGRGEVSVRGRKVVGLAQRRRRPGALVQCGLLRRWRPERLLEILGADPDDPEIAAAAAGVEDLLPAPPDEGALMDHVARELMRYTVGHEDAHG